MSQRRGAPTPRTGARICPIVGGGLAAAMMAVIGAGSLLQTGCAPANRAPGAVGSTEGVARIDADISQDEFVNSIGMRLAAVAPGEFVMGSPADEAGHDPDEVRHTVRITKPFLLGVYPVTQSQYAAVMGKNPSYFRGEEMEEPVRGDLPVESVSWDDAVAFCKKLSEKEGRRYRLPTEAEREYACRAGADGAYAGDGKIFDIGWCLGNSAATTQPVGLLQPNDWGFYDMQGNVWEWCSDWYGEYPRGAATDPTGPAQGQSRVLRGGCMEYGPEYCRCAFRNYYPPDAQLYYIGFRVVLERSGG